MVIVHRASLQGMKQYKDMTVRELKEELKGLHEIIYRVQCYGTSDMVR